MLMLASCRKPRRKRNSAPLWIRADDAAPMTAQRGFTLLEILVVLAIAGLLSAVALPQFSVISDRLEFTLNRESFERELSGLGYRAFTEGRPFVLSGQYPRKPEAEPEGPLSQPPTLAVASPDEIMEPGQYRALRPVMADDAPLTLPKDWHLTVEKPVIYQVSGFCAGGLLTLAVGGQRYVYDLKAPECRIALVR